MYIYADYPIQDTHVTTENIYGTMVLLTMTPAIVRALKAAQAVAAADDDNDRGKLHLASEPSLTAPADGQPIAHGQLVGLSKFLKAHAAELAVGEDGEREEGEEEEEEEEEEEDRKSTRLNSSHSGESRMPSSA